MLRINSGYLKGRKLKTLPGAKVRPTLAKTRGVIFDTLRHRYQLSEFKAFDLFAGSGILGIEALSNGITNSTFIEYDQQCFKLLEANIKLCKIGSQSTLIKQNATTWLESHTWSSTQNLFLIDPPYHTELSQRVVAILDQKWKQLQGSLIVIERDKHHQLKIPERFRIFKTKTLSRTTLDFLEIT